MMSFLAELSKENADKLGLFTSVLGHVGDGNFHQMVMYNPHKAEERQGVKDCVDIMMRRALEMEGTVSVCPTVAAPLHLHSISSCDD